MAQNQTFAKKKIDTRFVEEFVVDRNFHDLYKLQIREYF